MPWRARLEGEESELRQLAAVFTQPGLHIIETPDGFILRSDLFPDSIEAPGVRILLDEMLESLNGSAILHLGTTRNVTAPQLVLERAGKTTGVLQVTQRAALAAGPIHGTPEPEVLPKLVACAHRSPAAAKVLRLWSYRSYDWVQLYRIYEVVRDDAGGDSKVDARGWATVSALNRFRQTANSPHVLGDEARHGALKQDPPRRPMPRDEAVGLITGLVDRWLGSLA
jgi:hypothetical protein